MYPKLALYIKSLTESFGSIPLSRKESLHQIAQAIHIQLQSHSQSKLVFICTHNSRRSHFGQVWTAVAAHYYGIPEIKTYSGGTEATAFNPRAVRALEDAGFMD